MIVYIEGSRVYMDDILVWGSTEEEHDRRLQEVKDRIEKYNLPMNWSKCEIKKSEIRFIGDKMSCKGISPAGDKVEAAILQMQKPQCKEDVQRALGCINYVGKFIPNLANKCTHIRSLLRCKTEWIWGPEHDNEWESIKSILTSLLVLRFYNPTLPTKVSTDSSKDGLSAVLLQQENGEWKPVAYAAR